MLFHWWKQQNSVFWGSTCFMSSLWSAALARKTKSAVPDFPKVHTWQDFAYLLSRVWWHETLSGQVTSFEASASQTKFWNTPRQWNILRAILKGLYLHCSFTTRHSFTSITFCFFIFFTLQIKNMLVKQVCSPHCYIFLSFFHFSFSNNENWYVWINYKIELWVLINKDYGNNQLTHMNYQLFTSHSVTK